MRLRRLLQYRLATLLLTITCVAVALFAWMRLVAPNVTGFEFENGQLVVHLTDELGRAMLPDDPYFNAVANDSDVFVHGTYVSCPLYVVALALTLMLGLAAGIYFGLRKLVGRQQGTAAERSK